jgi:sulfur carrier protein
MAGARVRIVVNGEERAVAAGTTAAELVREVGLDPRAVAVERNGGIVPRAELADTLLLSGDRLEIVRFVQGGLLLRERAPE